MLESFNLEEAVHFLQEIDDCPRSVIKNRLSDKCPTGILAHDVYHLVRE
jgi:hypothetical protein